MRAICLPPYPSYAAAPASEVHAKPEPEQDVFEAMTHGEPHVRPEEAARRHVGLEPEFPEPADVDVGLVAVARGFDRARLTRDRVEDEHGVLVLLRGLAHDLQAGADVGVEPRVAPELVALADRDAARDEPVLRRPGREHGTHDHLLVAEEPPGAARCGLDFQLMVIGPVPAELTAAVEAAVAPVVRTEPG